MNVTILGSGSALPVGGRHPSAQLVTADEASYLIDCGEGTQYQMRNFKLSHSRIRTICISHLHGDHYYGLFGLLDTMALNARKQPLYLIAPPGLQYILLEISRSTQSPPVFPIHFIRTTTDISGIKVYEDEKVSIETFPLNHGMAHCTGFLFRTRQGKRKIIKEKLPPNLPVKALRRLKDGEDVLNEMGKLLSAQEYTQPPAPARSYAYCSDTAGSPGLSSFLKGVNLIYHEATFADDLEAKASLYFHSTARQAAIVARECGAERMLIGHMSSRYTDINPLLSEARAIFPNTDYAEEGVTFEI